MRIILTAIACVTLGLVARQATAAPRYSITDLGMDGESVAWVGINNRGQIVINLNLRNNAPTKKHFLLDGGNLLELPTLGGLLHGLTVPNEMGVMVGSSQTPDGRRHAVYYADGVLQDWGALGERGSGLAAINDSGLVVGNLWNRGGTLGVIFHGPNDVTYLGSLGGRTTSVSTVNNSGQITGIALTGAPFLEGPTSNPAQVAFLYENGLLNGIGTLGGHTSNGYGINDLGQIVGDSSLANGEMHAFIWDKVNGMRDLGTPGLQSIATHINNQGIIVGVVEVTPGNARAAIFDESGGPNLLQDLIPANSGWERLNYATDINDLGWIVGTGVLNGRSRAFLLMPIPEPSPLALLLLGSASVVLLTGRTNR